MPDPTSNIQSCPSRLYAQPNFHFPRRHQIPRKLLHPTGTNRSFSVYSKIPLSPSYSTRSPAQIRRYFPSEQLFLQVVYDPEIVDYLQLVLSILTKLDPYEAMDREDELDKNWSLNLSYEVRQQFCSLLEFPDEL